MGVASSVPCRPAATEAMPPPGAARWPPSANIQSWSVSRQAMPTAPPPRTPRRVVGWLVAQKTAVMGALAAIAVVALAGWGVAFWRNSREAKAGAELAEALELQSRPVAGDGPAQPGQETFPSKEERDKAVLAAL